MYGRLANVLAARELLAQGEDCPLVARQRGFAVVRDFEDDVQRLWTR